MKLGNLENGEKRTQLLSLFRHNFYIFIYFLINFWLLVRGDTEGREEVEESLVNREACIKENNLTHYVFSLKWQVVEKQVDINNLNQYKYTLFYSWNLAK